MKELGYYEHSVLHFHLTVCENIGSDQGRAEKAFCFVLQAINLLLVPKYTWAAYFFSAKRRAKIFLAPQVNS